MMQITSFPSTVRFGGKSESPKLSAIEEQLANKVNEANRQKARSPEMQQMLDTRCTLAGNVELSGLELVRLIGECRKSAEYFDKSGNWNKVLPEEEIKPQIIRQLIPDLDQEMNQAVQELLDKMEQAGFIEYREQQNQNVNYGSDKWHKYWVQPTPLGQAAITEAEKSEAMDLQA